MDIRIATLNDLPSIADIAAQAMLNDELFIYLCPHRHQYYTDFRSAFLRRLKMRFYTPGYIVIVATHSHSADSVDSVDSKGNGNGDCSGEDSRVRGYALWRRGDMEANQNLNGWGLWNAFERTLLSIENRYNSLVFPDRSLVPERLDHYNRVCATAFDFAAIPNLWFLATVAVDPLYQRRGIGRALVQWGLDRAKEKNFPVGLDSSRQGLSLYESLGFRTVSTIEIVPGLTVPAMLWEEQKESKS